MNSLHNDFVKDFLKLQPNGDKLTKFNLNDTCEVFGSEVFMNNETFSERGQICDRWGFLYSGMMKTHSPKPNNKSRFRDFNMEGYNIVVGDFDSISSCKEANDTISSKGESTIIYTFESDFNYLCKSIPVLYGIGKNISQCANRTKKKYLEDCEDLNCNQKLFKLDNDFPMIGKRINIGERAYYFGMSRNSG